MPTFRVSVTAHFRLPPHGINSALQALPGARFDRARGDLIYRDTVDVDDEGVAIRIVSGRVRHALREAGVPSTDYTVEAWGWPVHS
jgi:hypothetical protein